MNILVFGGNRFTGKLLVEKLFSNGHKITVINRRGIAPVSCEIIKCDRNDTKKLESLIQGLKFDCVIDMICMNADHASSSIRAFNHVKHFIMCSTVSTYGINFDSVPITEDHPLRPTTDYGRNKVNAENIFIEEYKKNGFPITIIRPSTTIGPKMGLLRQISTDFSWIDRIRKGKPILICGDGSSKHQFMHIDDAALVFSSILGKKECIGQTYNMVDRKFYTWKEYHEMAMKVIGKKVELIEVPYADLKRLKIPGFRLCREVFSHSLHFSGEKLFKLLPEFKLKISLEEGMREILKEMDKDGRIINSAKQNWEDRIIRKKRKGSIKSGLLINAFLYNIDRVIGAIRRKLSKLYKLR